MSMGRDDDWMALRETNRQLHREMSKPPGLTFAEMRLMEVVTVTGIAVSGTGSGLLLKAGQTFNPDTGVVEDVLYGPTIKSYTPYMLRAGDRVAVVRNRSDYVAIGSPGRGILLNRARIISNSATFTAEADIAGLAVTIVADGVRNIVVRLCGTVQVNGADGVLDIKIKEGGAQLRNIRTPKFGLTASQMTIDGETDSFVPTIGAHTYKITGTVVGGATTGQVNGSATDPTVISVYCV